jgi:hypothetical protein
MITIGYHGCSRDVGLRVVNRSQSLIPNNRPYHWLGDGLYFWENDPHRALEWAKEKASRQELVDPFVIGAVIDLSRCLDLHVRENQKLLHGAFRDLRIVLKKAGVTLRENTKAPKDASKDKVLRYKDCAVINHLNKIVPEFDTVRGLFVEGKPIYPGAMIFSKTHSEIAVRNTSSIKGYFVPDQPDVLQVKA